tara:strand:+ start:8905 stop:9009 length:105 start_codon:yes stop_codon:yes gene_type:complete
MPKRKLLIKKKKKRKMETKKEIKAKRPKKGNFLV